MINSSLLRVASTLVIVLASVVAADAQATRTWVSGVGDDANPCSRTAPCKTFAGAMSKTAARGEISVLDPGGFGAVTINKAITINAEGTIGSILSAGTTGVIVTAGANDAVVLRNISINGAGTGTNGIRYVSGASLTVDHCTIKGINFNANARGIDVALSGNGNLNIIDSVIQDVSEDGVHVNTTSGIVVATIERSAILDCGGDGVEAVANVRGSFSHSRFAFCDLNGVLTSGSNTQLNLNDTVVSNCNGNGLHANAGSSIRVSDSTISNNTTGLFPSGGSIDSFQGNSLIGNSAPGAFSSTTPKQ